MRKVFFTIIFALLITGCASQATEQNTDKNQKGTPLTAPSSKGGFTIGIGATSI